MLNISRSTLSNILNEPKAYRILRWRWISGKMGKRVFELESVLRVFLKGKNGVADCLLVQRNEGWSNEIAESFNWLRREVAQAAREAVAA